MTTVTVITGNEGSGRSLVGECLAAHIRTSRNKNTYALNSQTRLKPMNFHPDRLDDLFLISGSDKVEPWMHKWFERFGMPLFTIHITRHEEGKEALEIVQALASAIRGDDDDQNRT